MGKKGLIFGTLLGAAAAAFASTKKGKEISKKAVTEAKELKENFPERVELYKEKGKQVKEQLPERVENLKAKTNELVDEFKEKVQKGKHTPPSDFSPKDESIEDEKTEEKK